LGLPAVAAEAELMPKPDSDSRDGALAIRGAGRKVLRRVHHRSPLIGRKLFAAALIEKLATCNNALNHGFKTAAAAGNLAAYLLNQKVVG
jgi:hypothetical protein